MEQIIVLRIRESAFWKKGMFFDGELWSSVGISHGWSENFGFRCRATPIIITSMPMVATCRVYVEQTILFMKIVNRYFESKECFLPQFRSFDGGSVRIKGTKTLYLPVVHSKHTASYTGKHLLDLMWWVLENLASEKFVLPSESNLSLATGLASWKVSLKPCKCLLLEWSLQLVRSVKFCFADAHQC